MPETENIFILHKFRRKFEFALSDAKSFILHQQKNFILSFVLIGFC